MLAGSGASDSIIQSDGRAASVPGADRVAT
jgi:hypothetical protein